MEIMRQNVLILTGMVHHVCVSMHFTCTPTLQEMYAAGITKTKEAKYDKISPDKVAKQCTHLSPPQQKSLSQFLQCIPVLFSG